MKRNLLVLLLMAGLCLDCGSVRADERDWNLGDDADGEAPRVGLVLSGGGARGAAHVGVIRVLEELGIRPDYVAGTSMGAIVGGLYAAGMSSTEMEEFLAEMNWVRVLSDDADRREHSMRRKRLEHPDRLSARIGFHRKGVSLPLGVLQAQHFDETLNRILGQSTLVKDFDLLPIPFRAVATDLETGDPVVLGSGNLVQAIRASMSVPGIFAPALVDEHLLVDGGVSMNTPVEVVQSMGAEVLIVVDLSTMPMTRDEIHSVLDVTDQLVRFLIERNTRHSLSLLGDQDIVITPGLGNIHSSQFERSLEAVETGDVAARARMAPLESLAARLPPRALPDPDAEDARLVVNFIDIGNTSRVDDDMIRSRLRLGTGDELDPEVIEASLTAVRALDVFDSVRYTIVDDPDRGTGLLISAEGRTWGPNYLQLGLDLATDFDSIQDFGLTALYSRNAVNHLGGQLATGLSIGRFSSLSLDFYQPLDHFGRWFVQPGLTWSSDQRDLFEETNNLGSVQISHWGGDLAIGRNFDSNARMSLSYARGQENITALRGLRNSDDLRAFGQFGRFQRGELAGMLIYDTLDDLHFPTQGQLFDLAVTRSDSALGADLDFTRYELNAATSFTRGRWTVVGRGLLGVSSENDLPISDQFRLGGFGKISGLPFGALLGEQAALVSISGQRRLVDLRLLPVYAGATLEAGNTWRDRSDMSASDLRLGGSLFLGVNSLAGPVYLSFGIDDDGNQSFYFMIGNPFELRGR